MADATNKGVQPDGDEGRSDVTQGDGQPNASKQEPLVSRVPCDEESEEPREPLSDGPDDMSPVDGEDALNHQQPKFVRPMVVGADGEGVDLESDERGEDGEGLDSAGVGATDVEADELPRPPILNGDLTGDDERKGAQRQHNNQQTGGVGGAVFGNAESNVTNDNSQSNSNNTTNNFPQLILDATRKEYGIDDDDFDSASLARFDPQTIAPSELLWSADYDEVKVDDRSVEDAAFKATKHRVICMTSANAHVLEATVFAVAQRLASGGHAMQAVHDLSACLRSKHLEANTQGADRVFELAAAGVLVVFVQSNHVDGVTGSKYMSRLVSLVQSLRSRRQHLGGRVLFAFSPPGAWHALKRRPELPGGTPVLDIPFIAPLVHGRFGASVARELITGFEYQKQQQLFEDDVALSDRIARALDGGIDQAREYASNSKPISEETVGTDWRRTVEQAVLAITTTMTPRTLSQLDQLLDWLLDGQVQKVTEPAGNGGAQEDEPVPDAATGGQVMRTREIDAWEFWDAHSSVVLETLGLALTNSPGEVFRLDFASSLDRSRASAWANPRVVLRSFDIISASDLMAPGQADTEPREAVLEVLGRLIAQHPDHFDSAWMCRLILGPDSAPVSARRRRGEPDEQRVADWAMSAVANRGPALARMTLVAPVLVDHAVPRAALEQMIRRLTSAGASEFCLQLCESLAFVEEFDVVPHVLRLSRSNSVASFSLRGNRLLRKRCELGFDSTWQVLASISEWLPIEVKETASLSAAEAIACGFIWPFLISSTDRFKHRERQGRPSYYPLFEPSASGSERDAASRAELIARFLGNVNVQRIFCEAGERQLQKRANEEDQWPIVAVAGFMLERWEEVLSAGSPMRPFLGCLAGQLGRRLAVGLVRHWRAQSNALRSEIARLSKISHASRQGDRAALQEQIARLREQRSRLSRLVTECGSTQPTMVKEQ